jgi:hypothetical protein
MILLLAAMTIHNVDCGQAPSAAHDFPANGGALIADADYRSGNALARFQPGAGA